MALIRSKIGMRLLRCCLGAVTGERLGGFESTIGLDRPEAFAVSLAYIGLAIIAAVAISMNRDVTKVMRLVSERSSPGSSALCPADRGQRGARQPS